MALAPGNDVLAQPVGTSPEAQTTWVLGQNEGGSVVRFSLLQVLSGGGVITPDSGTEGQLAVYTGTDSIGGSHEVSISAGTLVVELDLDLNGHADIAGALTVGAGITVTGTVNASSGLYTANNVQADGAGSIGTSLTVGQSGSFGQGVNATGFTVGGNSVLKFVQKGSVTAYGSLIIASPLTLNSGGTIGADTSTFALTANNLSDMASAGTARRNINQGIGTLSTGSSTITVDMSAQNAFKATLTNGVGPYTLSNPTGLAAGATGMIVFTQPGSGSAQTLTYSSAWKFAAPYSNASPPPLTAALGAVDVLTWVSQDGTNCLATLANNLA